MTYMSYSITSVVSNPITNGQNCICLSLGIFIQHDIDGHTWLDNSYFDPIGSKVNAYDTGTTDGINQKKCEKNDFANLKEHLDRINFGARIRYHTERPVLTTELVI